MTKLLVGLGLLLTAWLGAPALMAQEEGTDENLLKAAFVFNFARFTRWPDEAWAADSSDLILCTAGHDGLAEALGRLAGKRVTGRRVAVQALEQEGEPARCHVLYIAMSELESAEGILKPVRTKPILTVSERPSGRSPAIISLFHENERIRFMIDLGSARLAGLEFSSRLLHLGVVVGDEEMR